MTSRLASVRDDRGLDSVDRAVNRLEDEWNHGEPRLERLWVEHDPEASVSVLAALVKADLRCRYSRGLRPTVAEYLERFPVLRDQDERVLSLIYEEFCLLEERGEHPDAEQFCARYDAWRDSLASQLRYHEMLSQVVAPSSPPPRFPEPGEHFEEYQLDQILGKGGAARVYLARDESLGGRPVALKISPDRGHEPSIQGRLDHVHIVPVHSVVFQPETKLRGLCMPFRAGLPLDEVIRRVDPGAGPRTARALWEAVVVAAPAEGSVEATPEVRRPLWVGYPIHGSYAEGVAWVVAALAQALAHAHSRGILHRDVKPANVLMTHRDGPQLLDFNLAYEPHSANGAVAAMRGGTLPYMAPEQLQAFLNPERWEQVGTGADLYSLGLMMCEMLTGRPPDAPGSTLPPSRAISELLDRRIGFRVALRQANPTIPQALEAIADRCLAVAPAARYPDASALADDLQRFLERRPLKLAVNPSRRERAGNWLWRNRRLVIPAMSLLILMGMVFAYRGVRSLIPIEKRSEFTKAVEDLKKGNDSQAVRALEALVEEKSDSPLVLAYLSVVMDHRGRHDKAATYVLQAIGSPSAEATVLAWGRSHPELARSFADIAKNQYKPQRASSKSVARRVFQTALLIEPKSVPIHEEAATIASKSEDYAFALMQWNALIEQAERGEVQVSDLLRAGWHLDRARNLIKWCEKRPTLDLASARDELQEAIRNCDRAHGLIPAPDPPRFFSCDFIKADALIELGLLEDRAMRPKVADQAYENATTILAEIGSPPISDYGQSLGELSRKLAGHWPRRARKKETVLRPAPPRMIGD